MPTTAESRALAFFAGLFAFGAAVRFATQLRDPSPTRDAASAAALDRHLGRVDSLSAEPGAKERRGAGRKGRTKGAARESLPGLPPGVAPELAAATGWYAAPPPQDAPPAPRASSARGRTEKPSVRASAPPTPRGTTGSDGGDEPTRPVTNAAPVDLDTADPATIEALPGIGPALARRLVADRAAQGPFGSLDGLGRVKGVGPVLRARLAERVTFSGAGRHP